MPNQQDNLKATIAQLSSLSDADRAKLMTAIKSIDKEFAKSEFKLSRVMKDKSIAVNVLNTTIADLESNKKELEKANEELSLHQDKLELSYREMEQFAYIASHDLKSPLRNISSFAQLLKRRYADQLDEDARTFIDYIVSGTVRMNEVICDSLEFSQVDKIVEKFVDVDLNEIIESVKLNLQDDLKKNYVKLLVKPLPTIPGINSGLTQLFQNLISNAIKFRSVAIPEIVIKWKKLEDEIEFRVSDNGIGMDTAYQEKVFQPFQRLMIGDQPGSGIGLAVCKKVVKMHGGKIWYESTVGQGTTFLFTLSAKKNNPTYQKND